MPFSRVCLALTAISFIACDPPTQGPDVRHPTGAVIATRPVTGRPYGVAISSQGVVYAARLDVDSVSFAQLPDTIIRGAVGVGSIPSHVAFNPAGTRAYVANQGSADVSVVNVASRTILTSIPLDSDAWNVIVSPDGSTLYATTDQGSLWIIATATNTPDTTLVLSAGDALRGLAFNATGSTLYVAGRNSGRIYVVNTATRSASDTIILGGTPQRMALSPNGAELYVANEARGLDIVTVASGAYTTVSLGGNPYGLALSPDAVQLYVTVPDSGSLKIVSRAGRSIVNTLTFGGRPRTVAFNARGDYAVVTNELGAALHFIH